MGKHLSAIKCSTASLSICFGCIASIPLAATSSWAQQAEPSGSAAQEPPSGTQNLPTIVVQEPKPAATPKPSTGTEGASGSQRVRAPASPRARTNPAPQPASVQAAPALEPVPAASGAAPATPLNTNAVAASTSLLGITVRETPSAVEVIDGQEIKDQGYRTVEEVAQGGVGVTSGNSPGDPSAFSMRGFTNSQITSLYNGIKIGPQNMTSRPMDTANLERVEILKGPASLMSGEGASGGAINFVTKQPHTGQIVNEAFAAFDSFRGYRTGIGSGGSTTINGLDYRFDISRTFANGFIDDTDVKTWNISTQLNYRMSDTFKVFGAVESKQDKGNPYWGTPLVSAAASGSNAVNGIVSGNYVSNYNGTNLGPVTIDGRTLKTNYNVLDNYMKAEELWLRSGFEWALASNVILKSQVYSYNANRQWFNNEVIAFNATTGRVNRERFYVAHDQQLTGNTTPAMGQQAG